jgi:hypothetical protein
MGMTERDRKLLVAVVGIVILAGFWLLVLGPKREALKTAEADRAAAQEDLNAAKAAAEGGAEEKKNFHVSYAKLVRLGKAIPAEIGESSLVGQLHDVARDSNVEMMSLAVSQGGSAKDLPGGESGQSQEKTTCDDSPSSGTGATGSSGSTGAAPSSGVGQTIEKAREGADAGSADANRAGASDADSGSSCSDAPTAADLAAVAAGLKVDTFELTFNGSFYDLHTFFKDMYDLVERRNNSNLRIRGRLLTISKIDLTVDGFPLLEAKVTMTGYRLPPNVSPTAGASPSGPAPSSGAPAGDPASSGAPPAAATGVR